MADVITTARNKAQDFGNTLEKAAGSAAEGVKNAAGYVSEKAKDAASNVGKGTEEAASYLNQKAEDATAAVGGRLKAAGDAIRHNAPHDGTLGQASSVVAKTLEETGSYLEREGLQGLACDMTKMIKNNPIPSLMIGVGLGFLIARATTPRS